MSRTSEMQLKLNAEIIDVTTTLRNLASEFQIDKKDEIQDIVRRRIYWGDAQGWTHLAGGIARGGLGILGGILSANNPNVGKAVQGVAESAGLFTNCAAQFEQGQTIEPQHKQTVYEQTIALEKDKGRQMQELQKEVGQTLSQLEREEKEAFRQAQMGPA